MTAGFLAWLTACGATSPVVPPEPATPDSASGPRIVAVGDLHGDLDNAMAVLTLLGVADNTGHWTGGDTVLVQTGDLTDRGPDSKALMALMRRLQLEAQRDGGKVVSLLGNHEVMNMQGDWRYVHPGDIAAYGTVDNRVAALAPDGDDGRWLRAQPAVAQVGTTVFAHGGISPEAASMGLDGLNQAVAKAIGGNVVDAPTLGPTGPLWYRGYVQEPEDHACPRLAVALAQLDADRMVVGHTTRRDGKVQTRCEGALVVIDIGIGGTYGGHVGGLELRDGDARAIYPQETVDLADPN